ncbi:LysR family transcriptional regulator [Limimaricola hongkongensis]|uniref:Transcriptional regulator, LysR family n=1 Tax=Limimaricola hongkongensis DSM 17492 TaxID=1122180 RepID=A0A017HFY5_9RHOB|nr:LysR family transcriptional regulator [Limimaricola hongkongensis]EYD73417.1 Transcriptional regulator, LysR family [Limimaricola hongkongensis DSM 17492]
MAYLDNIRTFVRVYELGSMSAAGRDLRISAAVTSARIGQLETHLGVRLFQRTTRSLAPTEQGRSFYDGARAVLERVEEAEALVSRITETPRGTIHVAAPLGVGRRLIAPELPGFAQAYPQVDLRLRLSDRMIDLTAEAIDLRFFLGRPADSDLTIRQIATCARVLCAAPGYIARRGAPADGAELLAQRHDCLNLRFPGATEFRWTLQTPQGPRPHPVAGRLECDDGDVLTDWALAGAGIAMKPVFEVADHLAAGRLVAVCTRTPPLPVQMACLFTHRRLQDPKMRLFLDHMAARIGAALAAAEAEAGPG